MTRQMCITQALKKMRFVFIFNHTGTDFMNIFKWFSTLFELVTSRDLCLFVKVNLSPFVSLVLSMEGESCSDNNLLAAALSLALQLSCLQSLEGLETHQG